MYLIPEKIIDIDILSNRNFTLAFTNGCFDILHSGHIQSLIFAKSKADKLIVALNTDESIKKLKGLSRPIVPLEHRLNVISAITFVDFVCYFDEYTPLSLIKQIKPDFLIKGYDYKEKEIVGSEFAKEVCYAPMYEDISTSSIVKNFKKNM